MLVALISFFLDETLSEGQVRLVPGPTYGRVEIYHAGTWGMQIDTLRIKLLNLEIWSQSRVTCCTVPSREAIFK